MARDRDYPMFTHATRLRGFVYSAAILSAAGLLALRQKPLANPVPAS